MVSAEKISATRDGLPGAGVLREAAEVFRLLANPVRLSLMHALAHDQLTVGDLARALDLSIPFLATPPTPPAVDGPDSLAQGLCHDLTETDERCPS